MRDSNKQSSQTSSKRKKFAEESDESSDSEPSTQKPITQRHNQLRTYRASQSCSLKVTTQGVIEIRNIHVRRNSVLKRTNTYILTFTTPILPKKIKAAYISVNVEVYVQNPLRCYNCQFFGHHESRCTREKVCAKFGEVG